MRASHATWRALVAAFALWVAAPAVARAAEIPVWPNEQEDRLRDVEHEVLDVQRKLSAARRREDRPVVEELSKQYKSLQDERVQLIRATHGELPSE